MFIVFVAALCLLQFINSHLLTEIFVFDAVLLSQIEFALILGAIAFYRGSMRERSILDIILIWAVWILATDWVSYFPPVLASIETGIFAAMLVWVWFRPYHHLSSPVGYGTVFIAFYGGPSAPFLSRIASHFGFPFSSIAIVADELAVRPSKAAGIMVEVPVHALQSKGYIFINTNVRVTPEIMSALESVIGTKTGYGIFRVKCLFNLMPVIKCLGPEWKPDSWPVYPARYYRKCLRNVADYHGE